MTITGHNLDEVTEVAFSGVAATPTHNPGGSLTVSVPPGTQETGQMSVATLKGASSAIQAVSCADAGLAG